MMKNINNLVKDADAIACSRLTGRQRPETPEIVIQFIYFDDSS